MAGSTFPDIGKHYMTILMEKPDAKLTIPGPHTGKALTEGPQTVNSSVHVVKLGVRRT